MAKLIAIVNKAVGIRDWWEGKWGGISKRE
jgi:hypothetical protein